MSVDQINFLVHTKQNCPNKTMITPEAWSLVKLLPVCICMYTKKKNIFIKKDSFVILGLGAEPSQFSWAEKALKWKAPSIREPVPKSSNTNADVETEDLYSETASLDGDAQGTPDSTPEAI